MAKVERKKRTKRAIFIVIALLLIVYLISSTYARYSTEGKASGKVEIAKWAVAITAGETTLDSTTKDITFTVQENTNVVPGKIAPDVTAKAEIELDLTGTEVSVDFIPTIDKTVLTTLPSADKITLTSSLNDTIAESGIETYIPLVDGSAFTAENGKKKVTLTLTWANDDNNNVDDTATGELADGLRTLTVPVTLTVQQHID